MMMLSSSSATVRVEKATSDLLMNPDWTMNIDICDYVNSYPGQAKDILQAVKKRLQHKNPKVQFLALTLLETMVKNCGDYVHHQIAEKNILGEMVKIVKKKADMNVRDKILVLLDSWQEAFGGPGGKYPQYYYAYEELRRSGVHFPRRSSDAAPIFTPPPTHPTMRPTQAGYGMPSNSSLRLDEVMATDTVTLSSSAIDSMQNIMELLSDMLQALKPNDCESVKDEVIVDLVNQCRSNQKKLMQMLTSSSDEALLARGLEVNDALQVLLARHDAIASGSPLPRQTPKLGSQSLEVQGHSSKQGDAKSPTASTVPSAPPAKNFMDEEEEEDEFDQLARRHSNTVPASESSSVGSNIHVTSINSSGSSVTPSSPSTSASVPCNALALADPPAPVKITKEQDMIDFLSLALTTTSSPQTPQSTSSNQSTHQAPVSPSVEANPHANLGGQAQVPYNSYVAPWAQPQAHQRSTPHFQMQSQPQFAPQPLTHVQTQSQPQYTQFPSAYPPPPWVSTSNSSGSQNHGQAGGVFWTPRANSPYTPFQETRTLQQVNSFPARGSNGPIPATVASNPTSSTGQKPFIPSYRLFEDLDVFGNASNGRVRASGQSPSLAEASGQSMVGGRK